MTPEDEAQFIRLALANRLVGREDVERARDLVAGAQREGVGLADVLVASGALSEKDRQRIEHTIQAQRMKTRKVSFPGEGSSELRFGSAAVHLGLLSPRDVSRTLRRIDQAKKEGEHLDFAEAAARLELAGRERLEEVARFLAGPGAAEGAFSILKVFAQFEILHALSQGAMGIVYRARDLELDKVVALKILQLGKEASPQQLERFLQEIRALGSIDHPLLIDIHTAGDFRGWHYYSMDFVEGPPLSRVIAERGFLDVDEALVITRELCRSVGALHDAGFLHRDIKPSNVILDRTRTVPRTFRTPTSTALAMPTPTSSGPGAEDGIPAPVLVDFGVVKRLTEDGEVPADLGDSDSESMLGTPDYMSPEQVEDAPLDRRSDVYSLGIVLYQMLTGTTPHPSDDPLASVTRLLEEEIEPPSSRRPGIDPGVDAIAMKALARDRNDRYYSTSHLLLDIERYFRGEVLDAPISRAPMASLRTLLALGAAGLAGLVLFFGLSYLGYRQLALSSEREFETERAREIATWKEAAVADLDRRTERNALAGRLAIARRLAEGRIEIAPEDLDARAEVDALRRSFERLREEGPATAERLAASGRTPEALRMAGQLGALLPDDPGVRRLLETLAGPPRIEVGRTGRGLFLVVLETPPDGGPRRAVTLEAPGSRAGLAPGRHRVRVGGRGALEYEFVLVLEPASAVEIEAVVLDGFEAPSQMCYLPQLERTAGRVKVGGGRLVAHRDVSHGDLARYRWLVSEPRHRFVLMTGPGPEPVPGLSAADVEAYTRWTKTRPIDAAALTRLVEALGPPPARLLPVVAGLRLSATPEEAKYAAAGERARGEAWRQAVAALGGEPVFLEPGPLLSELEAAVVQPDGLGLVRFDARRSYLAAGYLEAGLCLAAGRTPRFGVAADDLIRILGSPADPPAVHESVGRMAAACARTAELIAALAPPGEVDPAALASIRDAAAAVDPADGAIALVAAADLLHEAAKVLDRARHPDRAAADLAWSARLLETQDMLVGPAPLGRAANRIHRAVELLGMALGPLEAPRRYGFELAGEPAEPPNVFVQIAYALRAMARLVLAEPR